MTIHVLPPDVAAKIAAGEVVERPANIAKELIENSLDAGASEIRVEVREGGQRLLRVSDNGYGIPAAEAPLAFQRHATSKLNAAEDLDRIETLGFRGEALYSIAAVSNVTLTSRHAEAEIAVQLRLEGGELVEQGKAGAPVGTVVTVEHLFHNVPARRKFLRTAATEAGRIAAIVQRYALAYPACRFVFINEGRETFRTTGSGDLFDVLVQVYSLDTARQMIPFGPPAATAQPHVPAPGLAEEVAFMPERPATEAAEAPIRAFGYASLPTLTRANRTGIDLFVNRRYVEDRGLTFAVVQAYHTLLPVGRYPLAVVFIELDPGQVDVNVHPQKTQVRFVHERSVFSAVQKAVRRAVVQHAPIPDMDLPPSGRDAVDAWSARRRSIIEAGDSQRSFTLDAGEPSAEGTLAPDPALGGGAGWASQASDDHEAVANQAATQSAEQDVASDDSPHAVLSEQTRRLPPLRVVGQVGAMYIVAEGPEGVFLIDQHAAHERILYEKFMAQRGGIAAQHLLEPVTLHVGREITGLVAQHLAELNRIGFAIEPFGGDSFLLRSIPSVLSGQDPARVLQEIASSLAERRNLVGEEMEARLVKMVCKRAAIKAGQLLSAIEMQELVRQLEACDSPRTCPHGRPTMIQLSAGELEKAFGRI